MDCNVALSGLKTSKQVYKYILAGEEGPSDACSTNDHEDIHAEVNLSGNFRISLLSLKTVELTISINAFTMDSLIRILRHSSNLESLNLIIQEETCLKFLARCVSNFISPQEHSEKVNDEIDDNRDDRLSCFYTFVSSSYDDIPYNTVLSLLIKSLQKVLATLQESQSRHTAGGDELPMDKFLLCMCHIFTIGRCSLALTSMFTPSMVYWTVVEKSRMTKRIDEAIRLKVKEHDIESGLLELPLSMLNCNTLTKLRMNNRESSWHAPFYISTPFNLSTLLNLPWVPNNANVNAGEMPLDSTYPIDNNLSKEGPDNDFIISNVRLLFVFVHVGFCRIILQAHSKA
ncbi:hypothetical protein Tco_0861842 [Tanacetum coccineum]